MLEKFVTNSSVVLHCKAPLEVPLISIVSHFKIFCRVCSAGRFAYREQLEQSNFSEDD